MKICVRVMRKWKYFGTYDVDKPVFIGLVLVDIKVHAHYLYISQIIYTYIAHICSFDIEYILDLLNLLIQGGAMYAEIPKAEVETKGNALDLDKVYEISKFQVKKARSMYMPFQADLMIEISQYTVISVVNDPAPTFPAYIYNITPFNEINALEGSTRKYIGTT